MIRKTPDEKREDEEAKGNNVDVATGEVKSSSPPTTPSPAVESNIKEPKYNVKYRHTSDLEDAAVYQVQKSSILRGHSNNTRHLRGWGCQRVT